MSVDNRVKGLKENFKILIMGKFQYSEVTILIMVKFQFLLIQAIICSHRKVFATFLTTNATHT